MELLIFPTMLCTRWDTVLRHLIWQRAGLCCCLHPQLSMLHRGGMPIACFAACAIL